MSKQVSKKIFLSLIGVAVLAVLVFFLKEKCFRVEDMSNFKMIDNFDDAKEPNMIGGTKFYEISPKSELKDFYYSENLENVYTGNGYSLKVSYDVPQNEFGYHPVAIHVHGECFQPPVLKISLYLCY